MTHSRLWKRTSSLNEVLADGIVHALALLAGLIASPLLLGHAMQNAGIGTFAALAVHAARFFLMSGVSLAKKHDAARCPEVAAAPLRPFDDLRDDRGHLYCFYPESG
ncbi:MAG: hypothetical protein ACK4P8_02240 [Tabrizicola sp.]